VLQPNLDFFGGLFPNFENAQEELI
jgi:hypothetical protein